MCGRCAEGSGAHRPRTAIYMNLTTGLPPPNKTDRTRALVKCTVRSRAGCFNHDTSSRRHRCAPLASLRPVDSRRAALCPCRVRPVAASCAAWRRAGRRDLYTSCSCVTNHSEARLPVYAVSAQTLLCQYRGARALSVAHSGSLRNRSDAPCVRHWRCVLTRVRELLPTDGPRTAPTSASAHSCGCECASTIAQQQKRRRMQSAMRDVLTERAARPRISRISMFVKFAQFHSRGYI